MELLLKDPAMAPPKSPGSGSQVFMWKEKSCYWMQCLMFGILIRIREYLKLFIIALVSSMGILLLNLFHLQRSNISCLVSFVHTLIFPLLMEN